MFVIVVELVLLRRAAGSFVDVGKIEDCILASNPHLVSLYPVCRCLPLAQDLFGFLLVVSQGRPELLAACLPDSLRRTALGHWGQRGTLT